MSCLFHMTHETGKLNLFTFIEAYCDTTLKQLEQELFSYGFFVNDVILLCKFLILSNFTGRGKAYNISNTDVFSFCLFLISFYIIIRLVTKLIEIFPKIIFVLLIFSETTQHLICILLIKDFMELKLNVKILFFQFTVLIKYFRVFY